jgi:hypothetical protein
MPECQNCGSFVTEDYVRVFAPNGNGVREARAKRT